MQIPKPPRLLMPREFLCILFLQLIFSISSLANQNGKERITVVANNVTLENVLKQIEKQTGMRFMYVVDAINVKERINVNFNQVILDEVLNALLTKKGITWSYRDGIISLRLKSSIDSKGLIETGVTNPVNISGKVLDSKGQPIPGVTILVKGTKRGTQTDNYGRFVLPQVEQGETLLISSIGYEKKEIRVGETNFYIVNLENATGTLDETVVIAYGTALKRNLIGNVTTVSAEEIRRSPVQNVLVALQGRVPGLFINQNIGMSGASFTTMIQGQNSLSQGNDPFYVVDGVPYTSQLLPNYGGVLGKSGVNFAASSGNPLNYINPSDIESITVLKDADATAIYGSRAANGAILITTKKAQGGDLKVDVIAQQGWQRVGRKIDMMNSKQYLEMRREAKANDGGVVAATDYDMNGFWDSTRSTNWQKVLIGNAAHYTNLNSSISGGTNKLQYIAGFTYHKETTVFPGSLGNQKGAVHLNLNNESVNQKFNMQLSLNYVVDDNKIPDVDLTPLAISMAPTAPPLYSDDGTLNWAIRPNGAPSFSNPLANLLIVYSNKTTNIISNLNVSYKILNGLTISSSFGYNNLQSNELTVNPLSSVNPAIRPNTPRQGSYGNNKSNSWIIEPQLSYKNKFGINRFDILLGTSIQQTNNNGSLTYGVGYNSDDVISDMLAASKLYVLSTVISQYRYNAAFARFNYTIKDRYIVNLSARRDGSSRFGPANRFHNFWSVGAGYIFSEENQIKALFPFLSFGKLRANYGTTGNDQIGDYSFLNRYLPYPVSNPYRGSVGITTYDLYNPYLQWEETKKFSAGVDLGFIKDRILFTATRSINRSSNLLRGQALPLTTGFNSILINFPGVIQNTGWEFTINTVNIRSKTVEWKSSFNLTIPNNKLVSYPDLANSSNAGQFFIGKALSTMQVFHYKGVDPTTGVYQFLDSKGNITTTPDYSTDRTVFVNTSPLLYGGFQNSLTYKQFSLNVLLQYVKRNGLSYAFGYYLPGARNSNQPVELLDRWRKEGDAKPYQRFNSNQSLASSFSNAGLSDGAIKDASYIRVKNVELLWRMPSAWGKRSKIKDLDLFVQGQNLFTISKYKGLDPETLGSTVLPPLQTVVVGGHITL